MDLTKRRMSSFVTPKAYLNFFKLRLDYWYDSGLLPVHLSKIYACARSK
jgi:hypothetical protein